MIMFNVQKLHQECLATTYTHGCGLEDFKSHFIGMLADIGVDVRDYPEHQMMLLDYNQIEAKDNHPTSDECRGLLMGYDGSIIRKGFTRFYNLGQAGHDTFDFENSIILSKEDGSLMFVYWCPQTNQWEIGSRGTANAEGPHEWHGTFRQAMLKAMGRTEEQFQSDCSQFDKNVTRLYEYTSPDNRIVTKYINDGLFPLAYVNNTTGEEVVNPPAGIERACGWNIRDLKIYKFNTKEDCMLALGELDGLKEGYVCYNPKTKERVKIKSPVYLAAHRLRGNGLTLNSVCELVAMGEQEEYLAVFNSDIDKFVPVINGLKSLKSDIDEKYQNISNIEIQRDFALCLKDYEFSCFIFNARKNKTLPSIEYDKCDINVKVKFLKIYLDLTCNYQNAIV